MSAPTRIVIVGGVAGGATAAARARRIDEHAEITILERGPYVSYANCGLPYFISGDIKKRSALLLQTPEGFDARYRVKARVRTEAVEIDRAGKRVLTRSPDGDAWLPYDKLILAQGGSPIAPPIPGGDAPHTFKMWTVPTMDRLEAFLDSAHPRTAVVVGGGFVGLEMAEAFTKRGLKTTLVELQPTVMAIMDPEFGAQIAGEFAASGVDVITGAAVAAVHEADKTVELKDGRRIAAELVFFSIGVRPELALARAAGLKIGPSGGLLVDDHLRTSDPDILAVGDMVEVLHKVSGHQVRLPLAGPANRQGRLAAGTALGMPAPYGGALGTSVVKIFEATAAMTGLTERAARAAGFEVGVAVIHKDHHAGYYPGAKELTLKVIYDRKTGRLLGGEAFGHAGADKRIDVLATALAGKLTLDDLAELDLAYAPPYSSANDLTNLAAFVGLNDLSGFSPTISAAGLKAALASPAPPLLLDVRTLGEFGKGHLAGALHVPVDELRDELAQVPRDRHVVIYCRGGYRGHLALRVLRGHGVTDVVNLTGGYLSLRAEGGFAFEEG
jgi:NADPH-dependent 2,4-dienoyl-CoA reductase/sulfur reductase-like enzyme/rhodanese-related sulfurtransferase